MSDLANLYRNKVSLTLTLTLVALTVLGVFALSIGLWSAWYARPAIAACPQLAEQGEFIGGHLAAAAGMLTLAIVIYTGFTQSQQQQRFFMRRYFLQGVEMIERGFQIGDRLHAFRLIDYFARLAQSERDDELFLILNTGLSGTIRKTFESPDESTRNNYPFAVGAIGDIGRIQEKMALARKGISKRNAQT